MQVNRDGVKFSGVANDNVLAINAYCPIYDKTTNKFQGAFSVNLNLVEISKFLTCLKVDNSGKIFIDLFDTMTKHTGLRYVYDEPAHIYYYFDFNSKSKILNCPTNKIQTPVRSAF